MQKVNRLKVILNERNLTNSWLARQLDVNPTTVSKWCTNSSQPDILTFLKIASLLHLDVSHSMTKRLSETSAEAEKRINYD